MTQTRDGEIIDDRFSIEAQIGLGGMCTVFKAQHLQLHKPVAIKILNKSAMLSPASIKRFQRESAAISKLDHPNIVQVFGFGVIDDQPYMAMEFLEGKCLAQHLKEKGAFDRESFVDIASQICDGLQAAHDAGIVHRDLKPSNIMLLSNNKVKIVDFGIAKILPESGQEIQKLTQTGEVFGTLLYMSPEQFMATGAVDQRADIYSLGCIMYEMLTGNPANAAQSPMEVLASHLEQTVQDDERLAEFKSLIFNCMAKDPDRRPASAQEVKQHLAHPSNLPIDCPTRKQSKFTALTIAALCVALTIIAVITLFLSNQRIAKNTALRPAVDNPGRILEQLDFKTDHGQITDQDLDQIRRLGAVCGMETTNYQKYENIAYKAFNCNHHETEAMPHLWKYLATKPTCRPIEYFALVQIYTSFLMRSGDRAGAQKAMEDARVWAGSAHYMPAARLIALRLSTLYAETHQKEKYDKLAAELKKDPNGAEIDEEVLAQVEGEVTKADIPKEVMIGAAQLYCSPNNPRRIPALVTRAKDILEAQ